MQYCIDVCNIIYNILKVGINLICNLATMGGITVITLYVSVRVCVSTDLYHNFVKCGWIATKLETPIMNA